MISNLNIALNVLSLVSLAVVGFYVSRSKIKDENLKDLKDRVIILEKDKEISQAQRIEDQKAIANLEGQLATYREIPLKSIADSLEKLTVSNQKITQSSVAILQTLKGSAKIAKSAQADGGLLVKTKEENPLDVKPVKN